MGGGGGGAESLSFWRKWENQSYIKQQKIYECFRFPNPTLVFAPTLNILLWNVSKILLNMLKNGGKYSEKCNFYIKYFDKIICRPTISSFYRNLCWNTHIFFALLALSWETLVLPYANKQISMCIRKVWSVLCCRYVYWLGLGRVEILYPGTPSLYYLRVPVTIAFWVCPQLENIHLNENNK